MDQSPVTTVTPLEKISSNPFQTRLSEDLEHVEKIAASILAEGLLQTPVGRHPDGWLMNSVTVELAFGHTRLAAYKMLAKTNPAFASMPVTIRDLNDRQMFELAVAENVQRKDLTPIEQAKAMQTAREQFHMTSGEIGTLFGTSGANVRQKLRLLDLPESVQAKVSSGDLTEGAARSVLTVQKIAPAEAVSLAERISSDGSDPKAMATAVENVLTHAENVVTMHSYYSSGTPAGGNGLWPLTWAIPDAMDANKIAGSLGLKKAQVVIVLAAPSTVPESMIATWGLTPAVYEQISVLANPVSCKQCPFYVVSGGNHYCGFKTCHKWKKVEWMKAETARLSQELGIAILDPAKDGKEVEEIGWESQSEEKFKKWVEAKADHLRLRPKPTDYNTHKITQSKVVELVSINQAFRDKLSKAKKEEAKQKISQKETEKTRAQREENSKRGNAFLESVAGPVFAPAFACLSTPVKEHLIKSRYEWEWQRLEDKSNPTAYLAYKEISGSIPYSIRYEGPFAMAEALKPLAESWNIHLPADWDETAKSMEVSDVHPD